MFNHLFTVIVSAGHRHRSMVGHRCHAGNNCNNTHADKTNGRASTTSRVWRGTLCPNGPCFVLSLLRQLLRLHKFAGASHGSTEHGWPVSQWKQAKWWPAVTVAGAQFLAWEFSETMRLGAGSSNLWSRIHWGNETTCLLVNKSIRPGYLNALTAVGLSYLTCLCVDIGEVLWEWQTRRGTRRSGPTTEASHPSASPETSMPRY